MAFEKIRKIFSKQRGIEESKITERTRIIEDFGADPLDLFELIMAVEAEFSIEIPDEDIRRLKTIGDVADLVQKRL